MSTVRRHSILSALVLISMVLIACSVSLDNNTAKSDGTMQALQIQSTQLALEIQKLTLSAMSAGASPTEAPSLSTLPPQQTYTLYPTYTHPAPSVMTETAAPSPTAEPTKDLEADLETKIKKANILIFENAFGDMDIAGDPRITRAIAGMDFDGGKIVNVRDRLGDFKSQLNSSTEWDLIIASSEIRTSVQGEFYDYLIDHANRNVAIINETWFLDQITYGRVQPFLGKCGVAFQKDWQRDEDSNDLDYSLVLLKPDHEVFNSPNSGISLVTPVIHWENDAGDLLKLGVGGDAELLVGVHKNRISDYGVLASCMGGRTIIMTFSTHDYRYDMIVPLWQNMIRYTLTNHFLAEN